MEWYTPNDQELWGIQLFEVNDQEANVLDIRTRQTEYIPGLSHISITSILRDKEKLWVGTYNGINELDTQKNIFNCFGNEESGQFIIRSLVNEDKSNLLAASDKGLFRFNKTTKLFSRLLDFPINYILKTNDGRLWCATSGNGIILYDPRTGTSTVFKKDPGFTNGIISDGYKNIFQDRAGTIWFTSLNDGINLLHKNYKIFNTYTHNPNNINSLSFNSINKGFTGTDNISWIPTQGGGIDLLDRNSNSFSHLTDPLINNEKINVLYKDNNGRIWAGTNTGLFNKRPNINTFDKINFNNYSIKDKPVSVITQDKNGDIWLGIYDNLVKYSPGNNETRVINLKPDSISVIYSFNISCILNDNNFLWISTSSGIFKYDINKNSLLFFRDNEPYPISNQLWSLARDRNGLFWLGSWEGGLKCFNPYEKKFTAYKTTNGLPSNNIVSVSQKIMRIIFGLALTEVLYDSTRYQEI